MDKTFSSSWKSSKQTRKQRKYIFNLPAHMRSRLRNVHLSPELRKRYTKRSIPVRTGDKVKVLRGQFKGKMGKVDSVEKGKVLIAGVDFAKKDGTKVKYPFVPSNLMITEIDQSDKKRMEKLKGAQR
ncbi:MAG: 50S ribosomal protein L24 [Nanobdellota archaeon]